jgi:hypothetical protein
MSLSLDLLRDALDGGTPAALATCDGDGMPNVSFISQVHYVDPERVALSYQFFNKTRQNLLAIRRAAVIVTDHKTLAQHRLDLVFEETLTAGPLFERMKAHLAGIASHAGMEGVFHLRGADLCRVQTITEVRAPSRMAPARRNLMASARRTFSALAGCGDLGDLFDRTMDCLAREFGVTHAMILMHDGCTRRLYTVASHGYRDTGVGSEVAVGEGVVGAAARVGVPIRINHVSADYSYAAAIRDSALSAGLGGNAMTEIPFPGLAAPASQLALPIRHEDRLVGAVLVESPEPMRFTYDDEDALALVADHLGALSAILAEQEAPLSGDPVSPSTDIIAAVPGHPVTIRHFARDDSVFLDHDYLIRGVAGAILWRLLRVRETTGRAAFTTRELRLDSALRLPLHAENLDARLVLLRKRLEERGAPVRIEKNGRGRYRLVCDRPVVLETDGPDPHAV